MNKAVIILFILTVFISCNKDIPNNIEPNNYSFISTVDISQYPEISDSNPKFYDLEGNEKYFLNILKENGINTVRLRLWVNPNTEHSGFNEVKEFSKTLKSYGFKIWLTLHYSDTWADPAHQEVPKQWQGVSFNKLKDSVYNYTQEVVRELQQLYSNWE